MKMSPVRSALHAKAVWISRSLLPWIPVTHCPYVHTIYYKEIQKKEILIMCCFFNRCGCGCGCRNNNCGCGCGCGNNNGCGCGSNSGCGCGNNSGCGCGNNSGCGCNNDWRRSRAYRAGFNDGYAVGYRDGFNAASGCGCNNNWRGGVSPLNESEGCGCDN